MRETILSVGIDIGTSTTQLVFSRLTIENKAGSYTVPQIAIVDKEIVFRSQIYLTPLKSATDIDAEEVGKIIKKEYGNAGIQPSDVHSGAVIITGETARKKNANEVLSKLSDMAGEFVVATAGPELESVLSAKGAGTDLLSKKHKTAIVNIDIGGGTSNLALFENGILQGTACLDIGGRLIKIEKGKISYVFPQIMELAQYHGLDIRVGDDVESEKLVKICQLMADHLFQALHLKRMDSIHATMYTNQGKPLSEDFVIEGITWSGGVAKCMEEKETDTFRYGDVGILLARAITEHPLFAKLQRFQAVETIRATVVGAGNHTTEVSGSTISYAKDILPLKNLPVLHIPEERDVKQFVTTMKTQIPLYFENGKPQRMAISLKGDHYTRYEQIQVLADVLLQGASALVESEHPLIIVVECDIGKALGQALNLRLHHRKKVICIDGVHVGGDAYLDIGEPLAGGRVVPVVVKTLVFNT